MARFKRDSRLNVRIDTGLRQAIEAIAKDMACTPSVTARHLLGEALAHRRAEAMGEAPGTAEKALGRIAACDVRWHTLYESWEFAGGVRKVLESIRIRGQKV